MLRTLHCSKVSAFSPSPLQQSALQHKHLAQQWILHCNGQLLQYIEEFFTTSGLLAYTGRILLDLMLEELVSHTVVVHDNCQHTRIDDDEDFAMASNTAMSKL